MAGDGSADTWSLVERWEPLGRFGLAGPVWDGVGWFLSWLFTDGILALRITISPYEDRRL
jgi:hypothetical protein